MNHPGDSRLDAVIRVYVDGTASPAAEGEVADLARAPGEPGGRLVAEPHRAGTSRRPKVSTCLRVSRCGVGSVAGPLEDQIEVLAPGGAGILGGVPPPLDPVVRDGGNETLVEVGIFAEKRPLAVAEGHLKDT